MTLIDRYIAILRGELGNHEEDGPNRGSCEKYQQATGGKPGDPWCMDLICWALIQLLGHCPIMLTGSCEEQHQWAIAHQYLTDTPRKGCIGLVIDPATDHAHHAYSIVADPDMTGFDTIEGNSNTNGSREGTSTCAHHRGGAEDTQTYAYIDLPRVLGE